MAPRNRGNTPAAVSPAAASSQHSTTSAASQPTTRRDKEKDKDSTSFRSATDAQSILQNLWSNYMARTPQRVKLIDAFMAFLAVLGAVQFVYCVLAGNYPFNAFLAGFSATVGQFVLTASLRMQTNPANKSDFSSISSERAFADFVFGSLLLHFFCVNFIN